MEKESECSICDQSGDDFHRMWNRWASPTPPWRASLAYMGRLPRGGMGHLGKAAPWAAQFRRGVMDSSRIAHTLVETAKLNDVDPQAWLTDIFGRATENKLTKLDERLPWRYAEQSA